MHLARLAKTQRAHDTTSCMWRAGIWMCWSMCLWRPDVYRNLFLSINSRNIQKSCIGNPLFVCVCIFMCVCACVWDTDMCTHTHTCTPNTQPHYLLLCCQKLSGRSKWLNVFDGILHFLNLPHRLVWLERVFTEKNFIWWSAFRKTSGGGGVADSCVRPPSFLTSF